VLKWLFVTPFLAQWKAKRGLGLLVCIRLNSLVSFRTPVRFHMAAGQISARLLFEKLDRQLTKLAAKPTPNSVHRFRTNGRRLEIVLTELAPNPGRNGKKLLKLLARLRKKAGRVRDLDVQVGLLRSLKMPEGARHKSQLMQMLMEERGEREKKVVQAFDRRTVRELRKRLKRTASELDIRESAAWDQARGTLAKLDRQPVPMTEKVLHQYRILGKRGRYLAELAGKNPEAERLVDQLKTMQEALGEWHDWLKLTQRADNLFNKVPGSPLVAALQNLTRAKFRHATMALTEARAALSNKRPTAEDAPSRKLAASVTAIAAAA
jgi:CHAD domain-containing protein